MPGHSIKCPSCGLVSELTGRAGDVARCSNCRTLLSVPVGDEAGGRLAFAGAATLLLLLAFFGVIGFESDVQSAARVESGYALVEVDDPKTDLDVAPAPTIAEPRAKR